MKASGDVGGECPRHLRRDNGKRGKRLWKSWSKMKDRIRGLKTSDSRAGAARRRRSILRKLALE